MGLSSAFSTDNTVITVNGRLITDWSAEGTPIAEEPINQKRNLMIGQGGNGLVMERKAQGYRVTLSLNPASADAAFLNSLSNSGATIAYTRNQLGALESIIATEGVITGEQSVGRGGADNASPVTYVMEFVHFVALKGGL